MFSIEQEPWNFTHHGTGSGDLSIGLGEQGGGADDGCDRLGEHLELDEKQERQQQRMISDIQPYPTRYSQWAEK